MDRAWVLKVRVFGTRKWPIIRTDGSGQIKVYHPGLYGLNKDRAGRSPELLCVLSTRSYFTLASVARKDISWFSLGKRTLWRQKFNHILYWWGWTFCRKKKIILISFSGRSEAIWRFTVGPAWKNLTGIYIHSWTKKLCSYSDPGISEKSNETETFINHCINGYLVPRFESGQRNCN